MRQWECNWLYGRSSANRIDISARLITWPPRIGCEYMPSEFRQYGPHRWYHCSICTSATERAIQGNAEASKWQVYHRHTYPDMEPWDWRCKDHLNYKIRQVVTFWTNQYGDHCARLQCGHVVITILRGFPYAPNMPEQPVTKPQKKRCFACGDEERKAKEQ